jgi:hypothetical protein
MNKKALVLAALITIPFKSYAQSAELYVKGTISNPGTCKISSSNNGTYEFGKVDISLIQETERAPISSAQSATWTVACDTTTYVRLSTSDMEKSSAPDPATQFFGLGTINGDGKIGQYTVLAKNPVVDGNDALFSSNSPTIEGKPENLLHHGTYSTWAQKNDGKSAASGRDFKVDLEVSAWLASKAEMKGLPTDGTPLNGHLTLTFTQGL